MLQSFHPLEHLTYTSDTCRTSVMLLASCPNLSYFMLHSLTRMVIGKKKNKVAYLCLKFNHDAWKGYLCIFVVISLHFLSSKRKTLLFHINEIETAAEDIFQPGIAFQTACALLTNLLVILKYVHINTMFSCLLNLQIVSGHIQNVQFCSGSFYSSLNLYLFAPSLLTFIFPLVHTLM